MRISNDFDGLHVIFRYSDGANDALGFVIKPVSKMLYSEREGLWRGVTVGPLYFRTYKRRDA